MNILIAFDDSSLTPLMLRSLERLGHRVRAVGDGAEALRLLTENTEQFDTLIADWWLPGKSGIDLLRAVRELPTRSPSHYLYIMLLMPRELQTERLLALEAGADDFLDKPLDPDTLLSRLESAEQTVTLQRESGMGATPTPKLAELLPPAGKRLGEILVGNGSITPDQLRQALAEQRETRQLLGPILISHGWVTEEDITRARAAQMDVPYVAVGEEEPDPVLLDQVPVSLVKHHRLLPLSVKPGWSGETVRVAVVNPWNIEGLDALQRLLGRRAEPLLASESALDDAIRKAYQGIEDRQRDAFLAESIEQSQGGAAGPLLDGLDADLDAALAADAAGDDAPIIRLVNGILADAVRRRASDLHIEPYKRDFEIRYRIDGDLHVIHTLPRQTLNSLVSRLKVMAEMDISERRVPQDGRIALKVDGRGVDLRVSSLPTQYGERMVLRVLDRAAVRMSLDQLDFSPFNRQRFDGLIRRPHGIILVTGPTGSGKTTTLYASLNALKSPTTNIMTCEDPIEYEIDRISQSNVNPRAGLTFAAQLRAILRQDPDVILVGEIRDAETAETAFRAALTGHLVLSTLHCNESAGAPTRLVDMGVPPYLIASALIGVVAQRLLKRLCPVCHRTAPVREEQRLLIEAIAGPEYVPETLAAPGGGCGSCDGRGTRGRIAVHEVLPIGEEMQAAILRNADTRSLREIAVKNSLVPMVGDGLRKAGKGLTTLEEVQRRLASEGPAGA